MPGLIVLQAWLRALRVRALGVRRSVAKFEAPCPNCTRPTMQRVLSLDEIDAKGDFYMLAGFDLPLLCLRCRHVNVLRVGS